MTVQLTLGLHQKIIHFINKLTPHNLLVQIDLSKEIKATYVLRAIAATYACYPILKSNIEGQDDNLFFNINSTKNSDIVIYKYQKYEMNSLLNMQHDFPLDIYIDETENIRVFFLFNHIIVDKHSAHNVINQFLMYLDMLLSGKEIPNMECFPMLVTPMEELFDDFTDSIQIRSKSSEFKGAETSNILPLCFDQKIVNNVHNIKIRHGFSLHQLMAMCGLGTLKKVINVDTYNCTHLADLRRHQAHDLNLLSLGILSASFNTTHSKSSIDFSIEQLNVLSDKIISQLRSNFFVEEISFLKSILKLIKKNNYSKILEFIRAETPSVCISSLGKIKLYQSKSFQVKHYFNAVTTHPFCGTKHRFLVLNYEFNEKLYVNLITPSPAWTNKESKWLSELFCETLEDLVMNLGYIY